tara:strand:- start:5721 stop:6833 length:1113 start_codon:yes stop_codon:yes gene_type:complete
MDNIQIKERRKRTRNTRSARSKRRARSRRTKKTTLKKKNSYAPTFHNALVSLNSTSPNRSIIGNEVFICHDDELYNSKKKKCYKWNSKVAQKMALKNLNSNKKFNAKDIIGPKQIMGNCWLNCFFMVYFVSDKGHKFYRHLRNSMITGKDLHGNLIPIKMRRLLFIFNKFIETILRGNHSKLNKKNAIKMDTNVLIKEIYKNIPNVNSHLIPNINEAGNVEYFYIGLMKYMNIEEKIRKTRIDTIEMYENMDTLSDSHIIILKIKNNGVGFSNKYFKNKKKPQIITINDIKFKLDSAVLLDNNNEHFSAYVTINNKPFMYEGYSYSRIVPFKWKKKINSKQSWETFQSTRYSENFNSFMKGYQYLYYYRV